MNFASGSHKLPLQVFNLQRIAVLTTALAANPPDPELIYEAMKDRIHQPYRKELVNSNFSPFTGLRTHNECNVQYRYPVYLK